MQRTFKYLFKLFYKQLLKVIPNNFNIFYISYHPDSFREFSDYREYNELYLKWIEKSKSNNKGDLNRLWFFILNISSVLKNKIDGDFAEVGVYKGNSSSVLIHYAKKSNRTVYLFDTFEGFDKKDLIGVDQNKKVEFQDNSLNNVKNFLGNENVSYEVGYFPETFDNDRHNRKFAVLSFDVDLYEPMKNCLNYFYPLLSVGGIIFIHDYSSGHWNGAKKALDEFCKLNKIFPVLMPDKSGSAIIRKN
jgi:hypothetical protein